MLPTVDRKTETDMTNESFAWLALTAGFSVGRYDKPYEVAA